jgi:hypothetical protein
LESVCMLADNFHIGLDFGRDRLNSGIVPHLHDRFDFGALYFHRAQLWQPFTCAVALRVRSLLYLAVTTIEAPLLPDPARMP